MLDRAVDDQCLAVLAVLDDLGRDLPGSVHDARVALRKLRSTLVVFGPFLEERTGDLERDLRWFGGELGAARDIEVVRERVVAAADTDSEQAEALLAELDGAAAQVRARADRALLDPRLSRLRELLHRSRLGSVAAPGARAEVVAAAMARQVAGALAAVLDRAEEVSTGPAADEDLHRLRKRIKRTRFATETWRESLAERRGSGTGRVVRRLERLQDLLGEHQDAVVTAAALEQIAGRVPAARDLAIKLAARERIAADGARRRLPAGVDRLARAVRRLERRTPAVHLHSP